MKKFAICSLLIAICECALCANAQSAHSPLDMRVDMLTQQLERLESERAIKMKELTKCEKEVKNFKIAGISTLGLTGVGVGINIALASKLSAANAGGGVGGKSGAAADRRSEQQKVDDICADVPEICE
jgi:hypothetical protein